MEIVFLPSHLVKTMLSATLERDKKNLMNVGIVLKIRSIQFKVRLTLIIHNRTVEVFGIYCQQLIFL